jgi:hypothetical protein
MKLSFYHMPLVVAAVAIGIFSGAAFIILQQLLAGPESVFHTPTPITEYAEFTTITKTLVPHEIAIPIPIIPIPPTAVPAAPITFVGDIMLARSVELWMREEGMSYPFMHVPDIIGSSSATIANFEAAIPVSHEHTVAYSTRFSTVPRQ